MENSFQSHKSTFVIVLNVFVWNVTHIPYLTWTDGRRDRSAQIDRNWHRKTEIDSIFPTLKLTQVLVVWTFLGHILKEDLQKQTKHKALTHEDNLQSVI